MHALLDKLLLHITDECLTVYRWQRRRLSRLDVFRWGAQDGGDLQRFGTLLDAFRKTPALALVDMADEDFQPATLPHVYGAARTNMAERNLQRLYRDLPYRRCDHQGRQREGRRDDIVLYSAITSPELPARWLHIVTRHHVPLCGLHSAPHLSAWVAKRLAIRAGHVLMVSHHGAGIRYTYLDRGHVRFSRLIVCREQEPAALAAMIGDEAAHTRTYLLNSRVLARDAALEVVILAEAELAALLAVPPDTPSLRHTVLDVDAALQAGQFVRCGDGNAGDAMFLSALANARGGYPLAAPESRCWMLLRMRWAIFAASATVAVASAALSAGNLLEVAVMRDEREPLRALEISYRLRDQEMRARLPQRSVGADAMRSLVELHARINRDGPAPDYLLYALSFALESAPDIELRRLTWEAVGEQAVAREDMNDAVGSDEDVRGASLLGIERPVAALLTVDGRVSATDQSHRATLTAVRRFVDALASVRDVRIQIVREPLDVAPERRLRIEDRADTEGARGFSVTVRYRPASQS